MDDTESMPHRRAILFVFITILIDSIGFGIIIPVMPELIMQVTGEGLSAAARYGGWLLFVYAITQFFCAPVIGNLSDRFGRRPRSEGTRLNSSHSQISYAVFCL